MSRKCLGSPSDAQCPFEARRLAKPVGSVKARGEGSGGNQGIEVLSRVEDSGGTVSTVRGEDRGGDGRSLALRRHWAGS